MNALSHAPDLSSCLEQAWITIDGRRLYGHAEPGGQARVYDCLDRLLTQGPVDARTGTYDLRLDPALPPGDVVRVDLCDASGAVFGHEILCVPGEARAWTTRAKVLQNGRSVIGTARPGSALRMNHPDGHTVQAKADARSGAFLVPLDPPLCHGELVSVFAESGYFVEWLSDNAPLSDDDGNPE
jgi:hypothetical protein